MKIWNYLGAIAWPKYMVCDGSGKRLTDHMLVKHQTDVMGGADFIALFYLLIRCNPYVYQELTANLEGYLEYTFASSKVQGSFSRDATSWLCICENIRNMLWFSMAPHFTLHQWKRVLLISCYTHSPCICNVSKYLLRWYIYVKEIEILFPRRSNEMLGGMSFCPCGFLCNGNSVSYTWITINTKC